MKDKEDKYRLIAESTSDLICTTTFNLNPVYTYVNPSYKYILGYEPKELLGKSVWGDIHPQDKAKLLPLLKKYMEIIKDSSSLKEGIHRFERIEVRVKDKKGNWHYVECTANIIGDELLFVSRDITEAIEAKNKLKEKEELLSLILQSTTDGIMVGLKDGSFIYANDAFFRMWRIPLEFAKEKDRKKLQEIVTPQIKNPQEFLERLNELYNSEQECFDTVEFKDGRVFERYSVPLYKEGMLWGRLWIFHDITERIRMEKEKEKKRDFDKKLFDSIPYPAMLVNAERKVLAANRIALEYGAKIGDYCWKEFGKTEFISESDRERFKKGEFRGIKCTFCLADEAIKRKTTTRRNSVCAFGKIWDIYWKYIYRDEKGNDLYLHYAVDVTESRKAEEEAKNAAKQWRLTFDAIADPICLLDVNNTIVKVNSAFCRMFKCDLQNIVGKKCYEIVHKMDSSWNNCPLEETKKDKKVHSAEINDPNIGIPLLVTVSPIFDDKGELTGVVHIMKDISRIKKTQEDLESKIQDLEVFHRAALGREKRIAELKERIRKLEEELGKKES